jgi:hypothetical protein
MTYAIIIYADEGFYYHTPLNAQTLEEAEKEALEYVYQENWRRDTCERSFKIITIAKIKEYNTGNFQEFFTNKENERLEKNKKWQDKQDRELFEQLKKKFEGK